MESLVDHSPLFCQHLADLLDAADHWLLSEPADPWQGDNQGLQLFSAGFREGKRHCMLQYIRHRLDNCSLLDELMLCERMYDEKESKI